MDSLTKVKRRRLVILAVVSLFLSGLVIYGVMRPDPEEQEYNKIKGVIPDGEQRQRRLGGIVSIAPSFF